MWKSAKGLLQFQSVQVVVINEWRLGLSAKLLQVVMLGYILFDFLYYCSHLAIDTSVGGSVFMAVTDMTNMMFNATPAKQSCKDLVGSRSFSAPFNGATEFRSYENVRLRAINGEGFTRQSETALTVNTVIEKDNKFGSSCGTLEHNQSCAPITGPTPYSQVFGSSSVASADAVCILDWERYVLMMNATFLSSGDEVARDVKGYYLETNSGLSRVEILQSSTDSNPQDWLEEALPAVRRDETFRSRYWGLTYVSLPTLLELANIQSYSPKDGTTVHVDLHFSNLAPGMPFGRDDIDMYVKVRQETFRPFRQSLRGEAGVNSAWHTGGIKVLVQVSARIGVFEWHKFGIAMVSYYSYLLIGVAIVRFFLLSGHLPGLRYLNRCICFALQCGQMHRAAASNSWYRSLLLKKSPEVSSRNFSSVSLDVDEDAGQVLGLKIDPNTFMITAIKENSALALWNMKNDLRSVAVGDILVQVNGYSRETPYQARDQLLSTGMIEMTIRHGDHNTKDEDEDEDLVAALDRNAGGKSGIFSEAPSGAWLEEGGSPGAPAIPDEVTGPLPMQIGEPADGPPKLG